MKKILYVIGVLFILTSCESVLDVKPTNMIPEDDVRSDPVLVDAFLNRIYDATWWQSRGYRDYFTDQMMIAAMGGEGQVNGKWQNPYKAAMRVITEKGPYGHVDYWPYANIRSANEILQILEEATFDEDFIKQRSAEARFVRAFMYLDLVKRFGGVPLITEPQSIDLPVEELNVSRNTEQELYDFLASEMDDLVNILPESYDAGEFGRPTKWAAYALKSRAMLYAGSIAKYATVQLNGIIGIPAGEANSYYQKSYDAAMQIIDNSPHTLYKENPDPVKNYEEIFIKDGNSEVIFAEVFDLGLLKTHSWNLVSMPAGFASAWGSNNWMYLEVFEKYEYQDGSSGKLDWNQLDGTVKFDLNDLILKKDPRFLASAWYPEMPWQGGKVYFHSATVGTIPPDSDWPEVAPRRNTLLTGLMPRKRVDEAIILPPRWEDAADWIVFRTGEMYLNAAEAAFESGDEAEARRLINIIRERAGMPDKTVVTVEDIRNERFVELYCEEHRYWDIRRWRIAIDVLNGKGFHGVTWEYYIDEDKYTMTLRDGDLNQKRVFDERHYYFPMGLDRLADNPNLIENPGY